MRIQLLRSRWCLSVTAALLVAAVYAAPARCKESYYMIVYAAQREPSVPRYTHTFATFVKATGNGTDNAQREIDELTISWIAASEEVVLARVRPEAGINLNLRDTQRMAKSHDERLTMWGPFEIREELYHRALKQKKRLESGTVYYKALDYRFRPESAINCIHAVSDIDLDQGLLDTGAASGEEASRMVANHLRRWMIKPEKTHKWVGERLGLDDSVVTRRSLDEKPR